jgi:enoyl-CoA hydratase/carnithine racemase
VVPDAKLQDEAFALAKSMAEGPTMALRYMKDNLDEALLFDFATARDQEAERLIRTTMTARRCRRSSKNANRCSRGIRLCTVPARRYKVEQHQTAGA